MSNNEEVIDVTPEPAAAQEVSREEFLQNALRGVSIALVDLANQINKAIQQ